MTALTIPITASNKLPGASLITTPRAVPTSHAITGRLGSQRSRRAKTHRR
jgi:hypothetical protein